jgi:hypothetical protein
MHGIMNVKRNGDDCSNSRSDCFTAEDSVSGVHWMEGWVGSGRFGQDSISSF